jgi:hypothetical protein
MIRALVGACVGGLIGTVAWALVAYLLNLELGLLAWGVGVLAGMGCAFAARDQLDMSTGVAAAGVAVLAIAGGKYVALHFVLEREIAKAGVESANISDELATSYIADDLVGEYEASGQKLDWPRNADRENPTTRADYPAEVWGEAEEAYAALSASEKSQFKQDIQVQAQANLALFRDEVMQAGFRESFGGMDILFLGLAIASAYKLGSGAASAQSKPEAAS